MNGWIVESHIFARRVYNTEMLQIYIAFCLKHKISMGEIMFQADIPKSEFSRLPSNISAEVVEHLRA
jgi:hypothetical protein